MRFSPCLFFYSHLLCPDISVRHSIHSLLLSPSLHTFTISFLLILFIMLSFLPMPTLLLHTFIVPVPFFCLSSMTAVSLPILPLLLLSPRTPLLLNPNPHLPLSPPHHSYHLLYEPKLHFLFFLYFIISSFSLLIPLLPALMTLFFLPLSPLLPHSPCFPPRVSVAYRRIYPPDDKLLLEKYESLLSAAFQTFLAGRAASLQKEMNNPLKRMKARTSVADSHTHAHAHINIYTQYADNCGQENAREKKYVHISIKILPTETEKDAQIMRKVFRSPSCLLESLTECPSPPLFALLPHCYSLCHSTNIYCAMFTSFYKQIKSHTTMSFLFLYSKTLFGFPSSFVSSFCQC